MVYYTKQFLSGRRCPKCKGKRISKSKIKTNNWFKQRVYELVKDEYTFLEKYIKSKTKIRVRHNICGYEYKVTPNHFLRGTRCPQCNTSNYNRDAKQFIQEVYESVGNEYIFLEDYINSATEIMCKHNECGYVWEVEPSNFLINANCPQCAESKGEQVIRKYLKNRNIKFQKEYSFDDLIGVGGGLLRFDFAIFNNNELKLLVEYDGEFHFVKFYEEQDFEKLQIHDKRKDRYCKNNNIPLLRIPYWEFDNIKTILDKKVS